MEKLAQFLKAHRPNALGFRQALDLANDLGWRMPSPIELYAVLESAGYRYVSGTTDSFVLVGESPVENTVTN